MARPTPRKSPKFEPFEAQLRAGGARGVVGLDEVGRGCLAGEVVAAAVILPEGFDVHGLDDSKRLSPQQREALAERILAEAAVGIGAATVEEIGALNILRASLTAMVRATQALGRPVHHLLVDGNQRVPLEIPQTLVVKGDSRCASIAAASIVAKVHRDALMVAAAARFPGYGFEVHKGYGTEQHREAIARLGPTALHRRTFRGVAEHWPEAPDGETPAKPLGQLSLFGPGGGR